MSRFGFGFGAQRSGRGGLPAFVASGTALPQQGALVARWSAGAIPPQADGTLVPSWTDSVGGFMAQQATAASQPVYKANVLGGKPGVQFNGSQALDAGTPAPIKNALASGRFTLVTITSSMVTGGTQVYFGDSTGSSTLLGNFSGRYGIFSDGAYPYTGGPLVMGMTAYANASDLAATGAESLLFLNGGCVTATGPHGTGGNIGIGGFASVQYGAQAIFHEVFVWNTALTPGDMIQLQRWFSEQYSQPLPWAGRAFKVYHGDSLTYGQAADSPEYAYGALASATNGDPIGSWSRLGFPGTRWDQMQSVTGSLVDGIGTALGSNPVTLAVFEWYNSRTTDGVGTRQNAQQYLASRKAATPRLKIAFGTTTDSSDSNTQSGRVAYDNFWDVAANRLNIDAYVPIHNSSKIGVGGASSNATYFNSDGIHMTGKANYPTVQSGYAVLAELFAPAIASLG